MNALHGSLYCLEENREPPSPGNPYLDSPGRPPADRHPLFRRVIPRRSRTEGLGARERKLAAALRKCPCNKGQRAHMSLLPSSHRRLGAGALCPAGGWGLPSSSDAPVSTSLGTESHGSPFGIRVGCHCHNNYCRRSSICPSRRGLRPLLLPTSRAALCRRTTGNSAAPPQSDWGAPQPAGRGGTGCSFPESLPPGPSLVSWSCPNKPRRQVA